MPYFRKRPVVIEAFQFTGTMDNRGEIIAFMAPDRPVIGYGGHTLLIETLEGQHTATIGDWIIKGVKGEHYPCKPDIFAMTYEEAPAPGQEGGGNG